MSNDQCKAIMAAIIFAALVDKNESLSSENIETNVEFAVDVAEKIGDKYTTLIV